MKETPTRRMAFAIEIRLLFRMGRREVEIGDGERERERGDEARSLEFKG
jgi:hypothetical protein